jgi:Tfp pilus assembly protein PilF
MWVGVGNGRFVRSRVRISAWFLLLLTFFLSSCQSGVISAASLYIQEEDWASAERILQDELAVHPKNAEAWFMLGTIAKHNGIYTSAVYRFEEAARLDTTLRAKCETEIESIPYEIDPQRE